MRLRRTRPPRVRARVADAARSPDDEPTSETNRAATIESHITRGLLDLGVLTLHFPSRDVALVVDGGAASAALDFFARQRHRPDTSHFVPGVSSMRAAWFSFAEEAMAVSWEPGLPRPAARPVIDPVVAVTA